MVIETQTIEGKSDKRCCDLCGDENEVLIEKPNSIIANGELYVSHRPKPLWICLDCLTMELENI